MGTNAQTMAWMMDAYGQLHGQSPAIVTGKPVEMGGSYGRDSATGRGGAYLLEEAVKGLGLNPRDARVVIQGFDNVGSWAARIIHEIGYRVIAVSSVDGGVYNSDGLNIPRLFEYQDKTGMFEGFPGAEPISNDELLELECEMLIPAAIENVITDENAKDIKVQLILSEGGVTILPDILVNAGGVIVSYFEWIQNLQEFR
jgi:glutamate dehydrogenase (NAD(P)+)